MATSLVGQVGGRLGDGSQRCPLLLILDCLLVGVGVGELTIHLPSMTFPGTSSFSLLCRDSC